jgi:hypothetical protein
MCNEFFLGPLLFLLLPLEGAFDHVLQHALRHAPHADVDHPTLFVQLDGGDGLNTSDLGDLWYVVCDNFKALRGEGL